MHFLHSQHSLYPCISAFPAFPTFPAFPAFPALPAFPAFPAFPALPAFPTFPAFLVSLHFCIPSIPRIPSIAYIAHIPCIARISRIICILLITCIVCVALHAMLYKGTPAFVALHSLLLQASLHPCATVTVAHQRPTQRGLHLLSINIIRPDSFANRPSFLQNKTKESSAQKKDFIRQHPQHIAILHNQGLACPPALLPSPQLMVSRISIVPWTPKCINAGDVGDDANDADDAGEQLMQVMQVMQVMQLMRQMKQTRRCMSKDALAQTK